MDNLQTYIWVKVYFLKTKITNYWIITRGSQLRNYFEQTWIVNLIRSLFLFFSQKVWKPVLQRLIYPVQGITIMYYNQDVFNRKFCGNGVPDWAAVHDEVNAAFEHKHSCRRHIAFFYTVKSCVYNENFFPTK